MTKQEEIREGLAKLEHDQWVEWSKAVAPEVSPERRERWKKLWIPYSELTEEQKDQDRVWADKSIADIHSQGVVIKVDRELPDNPYIRDEGKNVLPDYEAARWVGFGEAKRVLTDAGYVAVKPLIEKK